MVIKLYCYGYDDSYGDYGDDDDDNVGWKGQMVGSKSGNYLETAEKPVKNYPTELQMN